MTDLSPLQTRVEAGIAWLVLNRPQQRNALDIPTLEALHVRLDACERDPAVRCGARRQRTQLLRGADLAEWAAAEARGELESYGWTEAAHALMGRLHALDKPTAAVNAAAPWRWHGPGAVLRFPHRRRLGALQGRLHRHGHCPDAGASWHLPRLLGSGRPSACCSSTKPGARSEPCAGLVGEVVADERLVEAVGAFAARLASGPTFAFAQTKRLLRDGAGRSLAEQLRAEQAAGLLCGRSEDAAEARAP